jgi:hypothetical protein
MGLSGNAHGSLPHWPSAGDRAGLAHRLAGAGGRDRPAETGGSADNQLGTAREANAHRRVRDTGIQSCFERPLDVMLAKFLRLVHRGYPPLGLISDILRKI